MDLQAGDLIFYYGNHKVGSKLIGWLQKKFNQIGAAKELYTHVAMVSNVPDVLVEMKAPEPRFREIDAIKRNFHVYRPKCDAFTIQKAMR